MSIIQIVVIMFIWAIVTIFCFYMISKHRGERASFTGGTVFLCLGVLVPMFLSAFLSENLACSTDICLGAKIQSQTLIGLFGISWASIGANLLAAVVSHR